MTRPATNVKLKPRPNGEEAGSILILGILMLFIGTVLALTLIGTTETELKVSSRFDDHNKALAAAEAGLHEALWRLRMRDDPSQPPAAGSKVTGYGIPDVLAASPDRYQLRLDSAYINPDPFKISHVLVNIPSINKQKGDTQNQDTDATTDEVDELDAWRDWEAKIIYGNYDSSKQVFDTDPLDLSLLGSRLVLPSVLHPDELTTAAALAAGSGRLLYTTTSENSADVLRIRFLREDPDFREYCVRRGCINPFTGLADLDGDSRNEIVYHDDTLPTNGQEDKQSIVGGDDATIDNESPYNLDHQRRDAILGSHTASGYPVLVIEATGRVERGGRTVARRRLQARFTYFEKALVSTAICTCEDMSVSGTLKLYSYDSLVNRCSWNQSLSGYPWLGPVDCPLNTVREANIGSNGNMTYSGNVELHGSLLSGGSITINGRPDVYGGKARARGSIGSCSDIDWLEPYVAGNGGDRCKANDTELEPPCACVNVQAEVQRRETTNDNAAIRYWTGLPCNAGSALTPTDPENLTYDSGFLLLPIGGEYYFENLSLTGDVRVLSGTVNPSCQIYLNPTEPIHLFVRNSFAKPSGDYLVFERLRPSEFTVWYWGDPTPQTFDFGNNSKSVLTLLAPYSRVDFGGGSKIAGTIQAKVSANGQLNGSAEFYYDRNINRSLIGTRPPGVIDWREMP